MASDFHIRSKVELNRINSKQDKALVKKCPKLYRERHTTPYGLRWGFAVEQGWLSLLQELSKALEAEIEKIPEDKQVDYHCLQVKQKFGTMRFYMNAYTQPIRALINEAEKKSMHTCEACGKRGDLVYPPESAYFITGWRQRVCLDHYRERALLDNWQEMEVPREYQEVFKRYFWDLLT